ncbi:Ig-like domain-containing protein [Asticcacaulis sp.]|uniref:Ig-like domain-containing protein n=1 Tax=Asticcacaulis sp. TaxID=1872648 RepID=UPI00391B0FA2
MMSLKQRQRAAWGGSLTLPICLLLTTGQASGASVLEETKSEVPAATDKRPAPPLVFPVRIETANNTPGRVLVTPSGAFSQLIISGQSPNGVASVEGQTLIFTPKADYAGTTYFTYRAIGPGGTSLAGTVTVIVAEVKGLIEIRQLETRLSPNKQVALTLQNDGNLVLKRGVDVLWTSQTWNTPANVLRLAPNGDLELRYKGKTFWKAGTAGRGGEDIRVTDKGAFVVVNKAGKVVWSSARP